MHTPGRNLPPPLPFAAWREFSPDAAARELHRRITLLPDPLRRAALAWLRPEPALAAALRGDPPAVPGDLPPSPTGDPRSRPLHGLPFLVKDLFDVAGVPTFAGSTFLPEVRPTPGDSALVRRLGFLGAALAGKTHLVEFASGLTGENPHYGDCPHPRFPDRLSGGSSSGSAALVAAGVAPLALGTDTGGSIRVPAAFCGLYGFRLTPGDDWIRDAFPLAPTMDTAGWFTAYPEDLLIVWRAMAPDPGEAGPHAGPPPPSPREPQGCHLPGHLLLPTMDPAVDAACTRAASPFSRRADALTATALLTDWAGAVEAYLALGLSEAHALHRDWLAPHRGRYDAVVWQRLHEAGQLPAKRLAAARDKFAAVRQSWSRFFATHDFLVLPSTPFPALRKPGCTPEARRTMLTLTAPASLGGLACLSLPVPLADGLTGGLQVILPRPDSPAVAWILRHCS